MFERVKAFFARAADLVYLFLFKTEEGAQIRAALALVLREVAVAGLQVLFAAAKVRAAQVDSYQVSNSDKARFVSDHIKAVAIREGVKLGESTVNLLVELAVKALKAETL